jgi:hypothetical protein
LHANGDALDARADLDHFGDDLVAERDWIGQRRIAALDKRAIEIAYAHRDRTHDRGLVTGQTLRLNLQLLKRPWRSQGELSHGSNSFRRRTSRRVGDADQL